MSKQNRWCIISVADVNISVTDKRCQNKRHVVASVSMRGRRTCALTVDVFVQSTQTFLHLPKDYQKVRKRRLRTNLENLFYQRKKNSEFRNYYIDRVTGRHSGSQNLK